eukprot:scaffold23199_cov69-Phaeocystis_antarctica.AAC.1
MRRLARPLAQAALLRAKDSLSTGWRARLCCKQRGRLAAASSQLRGLCQLARPESARERKPRTRGPGLRVCVCGHSPTRGACARVLEPFDFYLCKRTSTRPNHTHTAGDVHPSSLRVSLPAQHAHLPRLHSPGRSK